MGGGLEWVRTALSQKCANFETVQLNIVRIDFDDILAEMFKRLYRGGSSKLIERGSYRVKGASGVFRMRERGQGSGGRKSPSGVQGQSPPEAEAFLLMSA